MNTKQWNEVECPEFIEGHYYTYILHCSDGSYYVGSTKNLFSRIKDHANFKGAYWTKKRLPVILIYYEVYLTLADAGKRERQIKKWTRCKKEKLISGEWGKIEYFGADTEAVKRGRL